MVSNFKLAVTSTNHSTRVISECLLRFKNVTKKSILVPCDWLRVLIGLEVADELDASDLLEVVLAKTDNIININFFIFNLIIIVL